MDDVVGGPEQAGVEGAVPAGVEDQVVPQGGQPGPGEAPIAGALAAAPRPSLLNRLRLALRRARFRLAVALVHPVDGMIVSAAVFQLGMDKLAALAEWGERSQVLKGQPKKQAALEEQVSDVTRVMALAGDLGDPTLQMAGMHERFVNVRLRAMSRRRRERLGYEAAMHALEARLGGKAPPAAGKLPKAPRRGWRKAITPPAPKATAGAVDYVGPGKVSHEQPTGPLPAQAAA